MSMPNKSAPTLSDVAGQAGVSKVAASVVLNGSRSNARVSDATRSRILQAAADLRYYPNAMARGLVQRRMHMLGVLFHMTASIVAIDPYASAILQGILTAAADTGNSIVIFPEPWRDAHRSAARFRDQCTDGILVIAPRLDSDMLPELASFGLPLVSVSSPADQYAMPSVKVDNLKGERLAAEHLLALGHRRIAHLTGEVNQASGSARRDGFRHALAAAGVDVPAEYMEPCSYAGKEGYEATRRLLRLPQPPTAIFAGNDRIALAAMEAARDSHVAVPEELSLIGFDDTPPASLVTPPLTTVRQPLEQIGEKAARLLIARVEGQPVAPTTHLLEPELIVRGSTAPVSGVDILR